MKHITVPLIGRGRVYVEEKENSSIVLIAEFNGRLIAKE